MPIFPFQITPDTPDEGYMLLALKEAWKAYQCDEVPVGALIVHKEKIIARGYNQVEMLKDATAHAEMLALKAASAALANWRLTGATLYCTMEPCTMCAGALFLGRIDRLVWGTKDIRHGANGSLHDVFNLKHPTHQIEVVSGVLAAPSSLLLQMFFKEKRNEKNRRT